MSRFSGKVLFATGAARGLGLAIVERFLSEGAKVLAFDVDGALLTTIFSSNANVIIASGDVRSREAVQAGVDAAVSAWGRIDVLANVAGVAQEVHFLDITPDDFSRIIDINLTGSFNVAQLVARSMVKSGGGGVIINMSSKNGHAAEVKYAHYNSSKGAINMLTKSMALDLADVGIRVNAVAPGYCLTPLAAAIDPPEFMQMYKDILIPMSRLGTPGDIAGAFAFLASDDAAFMTGHVMVIDGGQTAGDGRKLSAWPPATAK